VGARSAISECCEDDAAVEGGKTASVHPGQVGEVGIGHLAVADDILECEIGGRCTGGEELISRILRQGGEDCSGFRAVLSLPDEESKKAALGDRTGGERPVDSGEPVLCRVVMVDSNRAPAQHRDSPFHLRDMPSCH